MKLFLFVWAFAAAFIAVQSALSLYPPNPDHPGHCYSDETGVMKYGEEKTIEGCIRASCAGDGSLELASCGVIRSPFGLTKGNLSKPYPDCCPQPKRPTKS